MLGWPESVGAGAGDALAGPDGAGEGFADGVALGACSCAGFCGACWWGASAASPLPDGAVPTPAPGNAGAPDCPLGAGAGVADPLADGAGEPCGRSRPWSSTA